MVKRATPDATYSCSAVDRLRAGVAYGGVPVDLRGSPVALWRPTRHSTLLPPAPVTTFPGRSGASSRLPTPPASGRVGLLPGPDLPVCSGPGRRCAARAIGPPCLGGKAVSGSLVAREPSSLQVLT
jgi:hypothetical protein